VALEEEVYLRLLKETHKQSGNEERGGSEDDDERRL
jgi:hypothetical protein